MASSRRAADRCRCHDYRVTLCRPDIACSSQDSPTEASRHTRLAVFPVVEFSLGLLGLSRRERCWLPPTFAEILSEDTAAAEEWARLLRSYPVFTADDLTRTNQFFTFCQYVCGGGTIFVHSHGRYLSVGVPRIYPQEWRGHSAGIPGKIYRMTTPRSRWRWRGSRCPPVVSSRWHGRCCGPSRPPSSMRGTSTLELRT